eukprot:scaffold364_cov401-Prasinococcus_capsulatus_cf.AAC.14
MIDRGSHTARFHSTPLGRRSARAGTFPCLLSYPRVSQPPRFLIAPARAGRGAGALAPGGQLPWGDPKTCTRARLGLALPRRSCMVSITAALLQYILRPGPVDDDDEVDAAAARPGELASLAWRASRCAGSRRRASPRTARTRGTVGEVGVRRDMS